MENKSFLIENIFTYFPLIIDYILLHNRRIKHHSIRRDKLVPSVSLMSLVMMNFLQFIIDNTLGTNWFKHK